MTPKPCCDRQHLETVLLEPKQRARKAEQKEERKRSILRSARLLFQDGEMPTVARIAQKAGLAKGTVYLYFKTKEDIFLALLQFNLDRWFAKMERTLVHSSRLRESRDKTLKRLLDTLVSYLSEHPQLMELASINYSEVEKRAASELRQAFRDNLQEDAALFGQTLEQSFSLEAGTGGRLLMGSYACIIGTWQIFGPNPIDDNQSESEELIPDQSLFQTQLREQLQWLWEGAIMGLKSES